jgi:hypothetical protein
MIKNVVSDIGGVGVYGIISITLFFTVFTGMLIWAFRMKSPFLKDMSAKPLQDGEVTSQGKGKSHEQ